MYGDGITRDLEPTKQDNGTLWSLFQSCMRVYESGATSCSNHSEACCISTGYDDYNALWALQSPSKHDNLLTHDSREHTTLTGEGWHEVCTPFGGSTVFCKGGVDSTSYNRGPFLAYSTKWDNTRPIQRCITSEGLHFIASDSACLGLGKPETVLGYTAAKQSSEMPRTLYNCYRVASRSHYHMVDAPCAGNDVSTFLGYVH